MCETTHQKKLTFAYNKILNLNMLKNSRVWA